MNYKSKSQGMMKRTTKSTSRRTSRAFATLPYARTVVIETNDEKTPIDPDDNGPEDVINMNWLSRVATNHYSCR